mgnify:CR=1 FL=1
MKVLVISDLHYDKRVFRDADESRAWEWLLGIVDYHKPDLLISLGDWGYAVSPAEFYELLRRVRVWSIYGNHDNLEVLRSLCNVVIGRYEPILMGDGEVRELGGVRFGAINGIVALRRREKKGVPRKHPEEFVEIARSLKGKIDILLLHDSPRLPLPEYANIADDERTRAVESAVREANPKIIFCGHLHISPYSIYRYEHGTLYIRVDSSQVSRHYLVVHVNSGMVTGIEIWRDVDKVFSQSMS